MKKGLIFVLFALVSIVSYSQISWNAKVGMNMSNFTGDMDTDMRIGFNVGVGMEYQFSDMWSIQPSLMFTQKGAKQDEVKMNPCIWRFRYWLLQDLQLLITRIL